MPITPTKFFFNPFAVAGDKTAIPNDAQPSGSISYSSGWGPNYALNYPSDPAALPVDRAASNQLCYDMTNALQEYQTWGVPNFIQISDNDNEGPYSYSLYAFCLYDDGINGPRVFQSLMNGNTNIPSLKPTSQSFTVSGNTLVVSSTSGYYTGAAVVVTTTGTLPSPLVAGTTYYVINISSTTISLATSLANALNNVPITLSGSPSGTNAVVIPITWRWMDFSGNKVVIENATFASSVVQGNAVYWDSTNNWFAQALADGSNAQNVVGIADVNASRVYVSGYTPILSGLTPSSVYYLSTATPGAITTVMPSSNIVRLGVATATTSLLLNIINLSGFIFTPGSGTGVRYLPDGSIEQWGGSNGNLADNTSVTITLPVAFPNAVDAFCITWNTGAVTTGVTGSWGGGPNGLTGITLVNELGLTSSCNWRIWGH